jgi:hypothetical protein
MGENEVKTFMRGERQTSFEQLKQEKKQTDLGDRKMFGTALSQEVIEVAEDKRIIKPRKSEGDEKTN